ncbi:MAG: urease accessory protein UreE [Pseudomonadota bacterium]|nr:urease accessory protein UreE [Pseudomonadota bacterium]
MLKVKKIINNNKWSFANDDEITLDYLERNRRRISLKTKKNIIFLLDEKKTIYLCDGSCLILNNNYKIKVLAKNEDVLQILSSDKKKLLALAWHIGNRHVPAEIHKDFILIKKDEVISKMLKLLGARILKKKLPFTPESGAYHKY